MNDIKMKNKGIASANNANKYDSVKIAYINIPTIEIIPIIINMHVHNKNVVSYLEDLLYKSNL